MAERETEFKFLLSETEHSLIVSGASLLRESSFVNRYFEVEDSIDRTDWVLRLRMRDDKSILTLKIGREIGPGLFDSQEFSEPVKSLESEHWENTEPMRVLRKEISQKPLRLKGEIKNTRTVIEAPVGVGREWELDRVVFPNDEILHELEIEVVYESSEQLAHSREEVESWLNSLGIEPRPSLKTKYGRFLESLGG